MPLGHLLAIARLRRIVLDAGVELPDDSTTGLGFLEQWLVQPNPHLSNQTPLSCLEAVDGEDRIRRALKAVSHPHTQG